MSTKKEDTRLRLLEAARKLLLQRGFHGVGLEDIAAHAGVSRQAVYKSHFASKAELLLELVQYVHIAENLDELIEPITEAKTALDVLEQTIRTLVKIEARVHALSLVLSTAASSDAGAAAAWRDRMEVKRGALRAALLRIEAEGRFSRTWTIEEAVDLLAALLSVDAYQQLVVERRWTEEALISRVRELCEGTLLTPPSGKTEKTPRKKPRRTH